ncbi:LysR substrate-binding domain-containing protein [Streptomyces nigra]
MQADTTTHRSPCGPGRTTQPEEPQATARVDSRPSESQDAANRAASRTAERPQLPTPASHLRRRTTDYFFARSLVAAGVGLSLNPTVALTPSLPGVRAVPLAPSAPARRIGAAVLRRPVRPAVSTLIAALREYAEGAAAAAAGPPPSGHMGNG